jgi:DNA-binding MarR family transcriptional regulator
MSADVIADLGETFLGSRLKRLAERMQSGAAKVVSLAGMAVQPTHMGLLAALDRVPMTVGQLVEAVGISQPGVTRGVGQLVEMGLVEVVRGVDLRERTVRLTAAGVVEMAKIKRVVWPKLHRAVQDMCAGLSGSFLDQIAGLEAALAERPLEVRAAGVPPAGLIVREFTDALAPLFHEINAEWISSMFKLEQADREVLDDPRTHILDGGGAILFVEAPGLGIIGTCAIRRTGSGSAELTKMGVRESARGMKAGEFLLAATIARAKAMGIETLYLLTNSKCAPAIHLYEKLGFRHDAEIMATYGARYERCDVAMRYVE